MCLLIPDQYQAVVSYPHLIRQNSSGSIYCSTVRGIAGNAENESTPAVFRCRKEKIVAINIDLTANGMRLKKHFCQFAVTTGELKFKG